MVQTESRFKDNLQGLGISAMWEDFMMLRLNGLEEIFYHFK